MVISAQIIRNEIEESFENLKEMGVTKNALSNLYETYKRSLSKLKELSEKNPSGGEIINDIHIFHYGLRDKLFSIWKEARKLQEACYETPTPQTRLIQLKNQLSERKEVLNSDDFKQRKKEWEDELADIHAEQGDSQYYLSRSDQMFEEEETYYDLMQEIFELRDEIYHYDLGIQKNRFIVLILHFFKGLKLGNTQKVA